MKLTPGTQALPEGAEKPEGATEEERWLRCAACGARITPERARIDVNGSHEHSFMNPSGLRFVVSAGMAIDGSGMAVFVLSDLFDPFVGIALISMRA